MSKIRIADAHAKISKREDFQCYGSMSGKNTGRNGFSVGIGMLPKNFVDEIRQDQQQNGGEIYTVFSYNTPIAWYTDKFGWKMPDTKYSVTTSKHQHQVRMGIK